MADKALLVGINAYPNAPLNGCLNDVSDMASFLVESMGFKAENIVLLCDQRAHTAAITQMLQWLSDVRTGDRVYFHFSGHGVQVPTRDYRHELDGLNEAICPYDFDWSPGKMLIDKQLAEIFSKMPNGVLFNWVSDSCHSGDLTKEMPKPGAPIKIARKYPTPPDVAWCIRGAKSKKVKVIDRGIVDDLLDVGFVSGCQSNQTSADTSFGGKPNGALTYFLLQTLRQNKSASLKQIVANTSKALASNGFAQRPQAEGARANKPFLG
jgi:metacaspase-1